MSNISSLRQAGENSTLLAIGSFVIGTLLLIAHKLVPRESFILIVGVLFTVTALLINTFVILHLIWYLVSRPSDREYFAIKILIMLANIPVAMAYFFIVLS